MSHFRIKERYVKFVIYLVVAVLINIAGITLFFRADLTKDKKYSLSQVSKNVVSTLSEPLTIKVFFTKNLPAPHNNTERYLHDLLEEYAVKGGEYFNYKFYNVNEAETGLMEAAENRKMANDYGIHPVQIRTLENDELKFKKAYMGLAIIHGDMVETIPSITSVDGLEYKLTTSIRKLNNKVSALLNLEEKVSVSLYLSSSLNDVAPHVGLEGLARMPETLEKEIEQLNRKSLGKINFNFIDPAGETETGRIAEKYNVMTFEWPDIPEKDISSGRGAAGIVMTYKDKTETLQVIKRVDLPLVGTTYQMTPTDALSEKIVKTMENMIGINQEIGYLADHGTPSLVPSRAAMMQGGNTGSLDIFNRLVSENYSVNPIELKKEGIPEGLKCLIIAGPTEKFSEYELFQIDQALMRGTSIAFFTDAIQEIMPQQGAQFGMNPQYKPVKTGLEKLLAHYGVQVKPAYVLDENCYQQTLPQRQGGGQQDIYFIPIIKDAHINNTPVYMNNIKGIVTMKISPLERLEENIDKERVKVDRLLSSSEKSWLMEGRINLNPMFMTPPEEDGETASYPLAYMMEGRFTSFFKGRKIPEKELETQSADEKNGTGEKAGALEGLAAENVVAHESENAKIFVMASSEMLSNQLLDEEGRTTNATFILNAVDHLNGRDSIAVMRSKNQSFNPLEETTPFIKAVVKTFNIAVLPVLVVLFGAGVWLKRSSRKKKIKKQFQETKEDQS